MIYDNSENRENSLRALFGLDKSPNVTKELVILLILDNINTATTSATGDGRYISNIIRDRENTTQSGLIKPVVFGELPSLESLDIDINQKVSWDLTKVINSLNKWVDELSGDDSDYVPYKAFNMFYSLIIELLGIIGT